MGNIQLNEDDTSRIGSDPTVLSQAEPESILTIPFPMPPPNTHTLRGQVWMEEQFFPALAGLENSRLRSAHLSTK